MKISGSVAVIIGAAHGIGKAIVNTLLQQGAKVCFGDVEEGPGLVTLKELQASYGEERVVFRKCDITQTSDIQELLLTAISKWGQIDIFCPVAGILKETDWELCVNINMVGGIQSVKEVMKHMAKDEGGAGGAIVMMSSLQGYRPRYNSPVYAATKSALLSFARSMGSKEAFTHHGIRFNCLCPGSVSTRLKDWLREDEGVHWLYYEDVKPLLVDSPGARPSSVAAAFARCIEDDTMNGQALSIRPNGGSDVIERLTFTVTSDRLETIGHQA